MLSYGIELDTEPAPWRPQWVIMRMMGGRSNLGLGMESAGWEVRLGSGRGGMHLSKCRYEWDPSHGAGVELPPAAGGTGFLLHGFGQAGRRSRHHRKVREAWSVRQKFRRGLIAVREQRTGGRAGAGEEEGEGTRQEHGGVQKAGETRWE